MNGFNKVILAGNLTRDPELRYTPSGTAIAKFGLAVNRKWKDQSGEMKEEVLGIARVGGPINSGITEVTTGPIATNTFTGQVNGTTGYEEAAGQGAVAGINAAAKALGTEEVVFRRNEAFIGVLTDDLVSRGVDEPYHLGREVHHPHLRRRLADDRARRRRPDAMGAGLRRRIQSRPHLRLLDRAAPDA